MRRAARIDANQPDIVKALRRVGCHVQPLHTVGQGCPDLLVCTPRGRLLLLEVKDGSKPPSERVLTPEQVIWHAAWRRAPVYVVLNTREAVTICLAH